MIVRLCNRAPASPKLTEIRPTSLLHGAGECCLVPSGCEDNQVVSRRTTTLRDAALYTTYCLYIHLLTLYHFASTGRKGPYAAYYVQIEPNGGSFVGKCNFLSYTFRMPISVFACLCPRTLLRLADVGTQQQNGSMSHDHWMTP